MEVESSLDSHTHEFTFASGFTLSATTLDSSRREIYSETLWRFSVRASHLTAAFQVSGKSPSNVLHDQVCL